MRDCSWKRCTFKVRFSARTAMRAGHSGDWHLEWKLLWSFGQILLLSACRFSMMQGVPAQTQTAGLHALTPEHGDGTVEGTRLLCAHFWSAQGSTEPLGLEPFATDPDACLLCRLFRLAMSTGPLASEGSTMMQSDMPVVRLHLLENGGLVW